MIYVYGILILIFTLLMILGTLIDIKRQQKQPKQINLYKSNRQVK